MKKTNRIVIVVEGGMIQSVYAEDKHVDIQIIDCDTDDTIVADLVEIDLADLSNDCKAGKLIEVY